MGSDNRLVKVIVPRANQRDVLAVETMLSALADDAALIEPFALEIAVQPGEIMFLVRGRGGAVDLALAQIRYAYPQCEFETLPPERDPALGGRVRMGKELRLRDPAYLPIRTHVSREGRVTNDDLGRQRSDPMISVISAMAGEGEVSAGADDTRCVAQYILRPMPDDWSKYWRGATGDIGERTKVTPTQMLITLLSAAGPLLLGFALLCLVIATLGGNVWMLGLTALFGAAGAGMLYWRFHLPSPPDPVLVKQKTSQSAYRVWARVFVMGDDEQRVAERMRRVTAAFRAYNLAGGNGFVFVDLPDDLRPQTLDFSGDPFLEKLPFVGFARPPRAQMPILCVSELAVLWHLPHGEAALQNVAYTSSRRLLPLPARVADGVWVGRSEMQGQTVEVRIPRAALRGNIGMVAKTQSGKSNLMALLAADVIASDPDAAVIVIDPHRTLARTVAGMIPPARQADTIYWSLDDRERPFGLNLLDCMPAGETALHVDKRVSDIVDAFREIWPDNWGPRMEDYMRWPLLTLATVNESLVAEWRFEQWRQDAIALLQAGRAALTSGRMDSVTRAMLEDIWRGFQGLTPPGRPSAARLHRLCEQALGRLRAADASVGGELTALALRTAMQDLFTVLLTDHSAAAEGRWERPSLLGGRVYGDPPRPLQFTLLDLNAALLSQSMQRVIRAALSERAHAHIRAWWRNSYDAYISLNPRQLLEMITPVVTKMNRFQASDVARRIFGQPESTIHLSDVLEGGKILLIDLAAGVVGQETAALIGSTILNWLASLIFARQARSGTQAARRVFIVVDEFQSIPGADYAFYLSELAKYGAQLCMGTQSLRLLDQVSRKTRAAWLDNTSALFVFRSGAEDAMTLARELSVSEEDPLTVTPSDIVGLPDYACFARVRDEQRQPMVFRIDTRRADPGDPAAVAAIVRASRERYGRDAVEVDAWLTYAGSLQGEADIMEGGAREGVSARAPQAPAPPGLSGNGRGSVSETDVADGAPDGEPPLVI